MKIKIALLFVLLFLSCNNKNGVVNYASKSAIDSLLTNWHNLAAEAKFNEYFNFIDSTSVYVGTDASEVWNKKAFQKFCKPYFDKKTTWDFKAIKRNIYFNDSKNFAWFDETLQTWMGVCRGSGVLELKNNNWKLKHYVLSVTVPNDKIKEVIEMTNRED